MQSKPEKRAVDGLLLLNKPKGISSNQALQQVKRLFHAQKAGHTGALDPLAYGMLPICLGEATKFSQYMLDADKTYLTTAILGEVRSTGDSEGEVIAQQSVPALGESDIEPILAQFRGRIEQIPPLFSALKLNGRPLYELARAGISSQQAALIAAKKRRWVTVFELQLLEYQAPKLKLKVRCSKGTYIRTLAEDIGQALGVGAYVSELERLQVDPFKATQSVSLATLKQLAAQGQEALDKQLLPLEQCLPECPIIELDEVQCKKIFNGQSINTGFTAQAPVQLRAKLHASWRFIGLGRIDASGELKAQRLINTSDYQ